MISFDEQRLAQAGRDLAESEKLCANETTSKFTRSLNSKVNESIEYFHHFHIDLIRKFPMKKISLVELSLLIVNYIKV